MKISLVALQVSLLTAAISTAHADGIRSRTDLGVALQNAVQCKGALDARDKPVLQDLVRLGVKVDGANEDGAISLTYTLPAGVSVFGYEAKKVVYDGDSGSIFYVELAAGSADLLKLKNDLQLVPIPKGNLNYAYFDRLDTRYYRSVHPPTQDDPYPSALVAGLEREGASTYAYVGCVTFDG